MGRTSTSTPRHPVRRILVIVVSRIGDTLFATPAIRAIAKRYPEAELTVLGHPKRVEVLASLPFVTRSGGISKGRSRWMGRLPGKKYDLAFVYGFDEELVRYGQRVAKEVVAFRQHNPKINARLQHVVEPPAFQSEHAVLQLLRLPAALGIAPDGLRLSVRITDEEVAAARKRLGPALQGRPLVGLQVASFPTKAYRDWPIEHFAALCDALIARSPEVHFLIFGGSEEKERTNWLATRLGARATCLAGRLSLRETAACMSLTDVYVGVDTGPTHIISTFDIPLVAMYHCLSSSAHTGPLDHPLAYIIDHPATGTACSETTPMSDIGVEQVLARVEQALTEHPPRAVR